MQVLSFLEARFYTDACIFKNSAFYKLAFQIALPIFQYEAVAHIREPGHKYYTICFRCGKPGTWVVWAIAVSAGDN